MLDAVGSLTSGGTGRIEMAAAIEVDKGVFDTLSVDFVSLGRIKTGSTNLV